MKELQVLREVLIHQPPKKLFPGGRGVLPNLLARRDFAEARRRRGNLGVGALAVPMGITEMSVLEGGVFSGEITLVTWGC